MAVQDAKHSMAERVDIDMDEGIASTHRNIGKSGNSFVVRIPPQILQTAQLEEGDRVQLVADMETESISIRKPAEHEDEA